MRLMKSGDVVVKSDHHDRSILVDYRYLATREPKPVIFFIHGFKGFKDWGAFNLMADYFAEAGFAFVKMNFSHNGTTVDQPTDFADLEAFGYNNFSLEQQDISTVLDYILGNIDRSECDLEKMYMIGHSRGGAAAILATFKHKSVKKLATLAAMNSLSSRYPDEVMKQWKETGVYHIHNARTQQDMPLYYQIVEDYYANADKLDVKIAVEKMDKPFIAFHGIADETLPVSMLHELKDWNANVIIHEMPDANHVFGSTHPYEEGTLPKDLKYTIDETIQMFNQA